MLPYKLEMLLPPKRQLIPENTQKNWAANFYLFHEPLSLISPKATKLVRLYCGWFNTKGLIVIDMPRQRIPIEAIPPQYHQSLLSSPMPHYHYFDAVATLIWELMNQRLPAVGRNPAYIITFIKNWCGYNEILNDKTIHKIIQDYVDPRYIQYSLRYLLNEKVFYLDDCPQIRYKVLTVLEYFQQYTRSLHINSIKSQRQLTQGLNHLVRHAYNVPCVIRHREFTKATRHIRIPNLPHKMAGKHT